MQEKIIKIPFNSKFFLKSHKAIWAFSNNKKITPYIIYTVLGALSLFVGLTLEKGEKFPLSTILGGGYLFYMSLVWIGLFERRIRYFNKIKKHLLRYEQEPMDCIYTFSDDGFEYQDKEKRFRLNWSLISPFLIYKDDILLISRDNLGIVFAIGRYEIGDEEYLELCNIFREKTVKS